MCIKLTLLLNKSSISFSLSLMSHYMKKQETKILCMHNCFILKKILSMRVPIKSKNSCILMSLEIKWAFICQATNGMKRKKKYSFRFLFKFFVSFIDWKKGNDSLWKVVFFLRFQWLISIVLKKNSVFCFFFHTFSSGCNLEVDKAPVTVIQQNENIWMNTMPRIVF